MNPFFSDSDFDFTTRCVIGYSAQGVLDIGEVFATIAQIHDGDADSWYAAWRATADKLHARATASLAAGRRVTASREFLAASESYSQAIGFSDGMTDASVFNAVFALHRECWEAFVDADGRIERVKVPYEGTTLPGYLVRPDASGAKRPTVVLNNGSDGSISGLWATGASTAIERGYNAFLFDGPGQQSMLFDQGVPFRPDWEHVVTPIVEFLRGRPEVDEDRIALYGISQAGYWVPRALAYEHRIAAAIADPGVVDVSTSWLQHLPKEMVAMLDDGDRKTFEEWMQFGTSTPQEAQEFAWRAKPYGITDPFDLFDEVRKYKLEPDVIGMVTTPLLVTDPEGEQFWRGQSKQLFDAVSAPKQIVSFRATEGADLHCEPMGRSLLEQRVFDWLDETLR